MTLFFANSDSDSLDREVLRPLSHIKGNWELSWDSSTQRYKEENDSFAKLLNELIDELDAASPPSKYHENEDKLAEYVRDNLNWSIHKVGARWIGVDYDSIIEQGGFGDLDERNLVLAAAGRVRAAQVRGQSHFDEMEKSHRQMLGSVLSVILFQRMNLDYQSDDDCNSLEGVND